MPENEFEKQVKELMEELHFSPSAPVWEKIKKRISEKKRRVWPIFFLFISVALISGYFFYADINHANQTATKNSKTVNAVPAKKDVPANTTHEKNVQQNPGIEKQLNASTLIAKKANTKSANTIDDLKSGKIVTVHQPLIIQNNNSVIAAIPAEKNEITNQQTPNPGNSISATTNENFDSTGINKNNLANNNSTTDSLVKLNNELHTDSVLLQKKNQAKKIRNNKWQFGITAMYGISNINSSAFNFNGNKALQASPAFGNPQPTAANPGALKNPYDKNSAYSFGLIVQRKIARNSSLNTGLNFMHLSSKSNTALSINYSLVAVADYLQNNNTASNFYRIGSIKTYTNSFNFIELPATFQSNLFSVKYFSVLYNAGGSVMQMISSKSLIYNSNDNSFFKNDDLLRCTQFRLTAGLDFQLSTKRNGKFLLGPHVEYSLSPYLKNNDYNRLHFTNYGLRASWLFNKK
jgi:hypothetical protein